MLGLSEELFSVRFAFKCYMWALSSSSPMTAIKIHQKTGKTQTNIIAANEHMVLNPNYDGPNSVRLHSMARLRVNSFSSFPQNELIMTIKAQATVTA